MLGSRPSLVSPPPPSLLPKQMIETEESIIQKLLAMPNVTVLIFYLCTKEAYLITALNNHEAILKGRFSSENIISIACSKYKNCELIVNSLYFPTLDKATQDTINIIFKNYLYSKSRFSSDAPTPSYPPHSSIFSPPP